MNPEEYTNLDRIEARHWYYAGKREIARRWLARAKPFQPDAELLDCGAGTGRFAREMTPFCRVRVLDDHEGALRFLRARFRPEQVLELAGDRVPLPDGSLDYVTALDVLEHISDDEAAVKGFARLLRPGGVVLITVPACMALWSDWDVGLHHYRRYSRSGLSRLFPAETWEPVYLNYTNVAAFPAVWLLRRWRKWFPQRPGVARSEDRLPPAWLNGLLRLLFVGPAFWRVPFPAGVSLLLVARRRQGPASGAAGH